MLKSFSKNQPFLIFFILAIFASPAFAQYFTIDRFQSDITVHQDASLIVGETIELRFDRPRHGIYREIPFRFHNELGKVTTTPIKVLSVTDGSGKNLKYTVERKGSVVHIRVGDPKRYVEGRQTYGITYQVENAIFFLEDHDELYWNVTGNAWKAPIIETSARVTLSSRKKSKSFWKGCYAGVYGSSESDCGYETYQNSAKFHAKRRLNTGEGFTIAFGWEKGLLTPPSAWKRFLWSIDIRENWVFIVPFFALFCMIQLWHRRGRDPRVKEAVTVMYEPPQYNHQPLSPAEVGALIDERLDPRDITSTLVGLAVKGYLTIEETEKQGWIFQSTDYYLKKVKEPDAHLCPFETEMMRSLFPAAMPGILVSQMKNRFYTNLDVLKRTLYRDLVRKGFFLKNPESVRNLYIMGAILITVFGSLVLLFLAPNSPVKSILAGVFTGLPVLFFSKFMPAKTKAGASAYMEILGFQEFMNRAEKDRIERLGDKDLFSRFLPYAIALNVVDHWAGAFEGIYQETPQWFVSSAGPTTFSPSGFSRSIDSATSSLASAMFSSPRGSGVSGGGGGDGGGSSGGGFGGGGGGSW